MKTKKKELVSDELKPFVSKLIRENRQKYNYSFEDLSKAINRKKNRQTLHKYENGLLNIPYEILFDICQVFNIDISDIENDIDNNEDLKVMEAKFVKSYISSTRKEKNLSKKNEQLLNTYKNAMYEQSIRKSQIYVKMLDDSMYPYYEKNDQIYFEKQEEYKNGDDIVIAIKSNVLSVRKLYKYPKGLILQAMNPKYPSINVNIISNEMILGKVTAIYRETK